MDIQKERIPNLERVEESEKSLRDWLVLDSKLFKNLPQVSKHFWTMECTGVYLLISL